MAAAAVSRYNGHMNKDVPGLLTFQAAAPTTEGLPSCVTEPLRSWFTARFDRPTAAQQRAWPLLASRQHTLIIAPTGHGKSLAAFVPILQELLAHPFATAIRCVYIAPLKALLNDVRRTLQQCLRELGPQLPAGSSAFRVAVRSGDTSALARRQLLLDPPDILLTTPESLAVLLTQPAALNVLAGVQWLVVDEIHALANNKRGADLSLSLERLQEQAGRDIQRIGLSATCHPVQEAARFLVGTHRNCAIVPVAEPSQFELAIEPAGFRAADDSWLGQRFFGHLLQRLPAEIERNQTTLIFTNTRSLAERLVWALRRQLPELADQIAGHHSALARRTRRRVEKQLQQGQLRVAVSSTSLELGIDIGSVDGVVLIHPPGGAARLLQRLGRAGHAPGRLRRGLLLVSNAAELLEGTVTAAASQQGQLEALAIPEQPLDVLCQHLLGMAAQRPWTAAEAYELVTRSYPFADLTSGDFEACLDYLSGRTRQGQEWLPARLHWCADRFTLAEARTLKILRRNLGTILGEDTIKVRRLDKTAIGEIEPAFADRLQPGDRFLLDGRCLEYRRLTRQTLLVEEVAGRPVTPRWQGEGWPWPAELARRLFLFRMQAAELLLQGPQMLQHWLEQELGLPAATAALLTHYFQRQETISEIPDTSALLIEAVAAETGINYFFHTPLQRAGNEALARVLEWRLRRDGWPGQAPLAANLGFLVALPTPREVAPDLWRRWLSVDNFQVDLEASLADSLLLRERFQRVALTGLMLLRHPLGDKLRVGGRDWAERRLFAQLQAREPDFVLLRQAKKEVLQDCVAASDALRYLQEAARQPMRLRWLPCLSPFAENWTQSLFTGDEVLGDPLQALERLHAALMGAPADSPAGS